MRMLGVTTEIVCCPVEGEVDERVAGHAVPTEVNAQVTHERSSASPHPKLRGVRRTRAQFERSESECMLKKKAERAIEMIK